MKLLFISSRDVNNKSNGGFQCTNRNYLSFCELIGADKVEVMNLSVGESFSAKLSKWINYGRGYSAGISQNAINKVLKAAWQNDYVFIDSSIYGVLAYYLKKEGYTGKIISFFHNVEHNIWIERSKRKPMNFWRIFLVHYNEKMALRYSDKIVVLNSRDMDELARIYNINAGNMDIIPISFSDSFIEEKVKLNGLTSVPPALLFVGNNWYANIHGITWFIKNVLDHVDAKLMIAGSGMDILKDKFIHPKIEFLGYVPDLKPLIMQSDFIISPIFKGGGMKVKTCEALMYGKNIIGTDEAFQGYEIDHRVGAICNSKDEFIRFIKTDCSIKREKFNDYSRKVFLDKYSLQATLLKFRELLKN